MYNKLRFQLLPFHCGCSRVRCWLHLLYPALAYVAVLWCVLSLSPLMALATDSEQDILIAADRAEFDEVTNVATYYGAVEVNQGTIRITGEKLIVYLNEEDEMREAIVTGNPATWRQLPEDSEVYDEAEAQRIEYYKEKSFVLLLQQVTVTQEDQIVRGQRVEYDTENNRAVATAGKPASDKKEPADGTAGERVQIVIRNRKKEADEDQSTIEKSSTAE